MADVITVRIPDLPAIAEPSGDEQIAVWQSGRLGQIRQGALRGTRTFSGQSAPPSEPTAIMALKPILGDRWRNTTTGDEWKATSLSPFVWTTDGNLKGADGANSTVPGPAGRPGDRGQQGIQGLRGPPATVNGKSGETITLNQTDIGLGNVENFSRAHMAATGPIADSIGAKADAAATQASLNAKAPILNNLTANGTTDDRAALAFADALQGFGEWLLKPGTIRISSNITLSAHYRFPRGVKLKPDSGVTITFTAGLTAGNYQIFDLSAGGSIAGLAVCEVDWFHGFKNTTTDCIAATQKALDALVNNGLGLMGAGEYRAAGGTLIATRGQSLVGRGRAITRVRWSTGTTNFIRTTGVPGSRIAGIDMGPVSLAVRPTAGVALDMQVSGYFNDINISTAYRGISIKNSAGVRGYDFGVSDGRETAVYIENSNDVFLSQFVTASICDTINFSSVTGTFQAGEGLTISGSPFTGLNIIQLTGTQYRMLIPNQLPAGTTVTGNASGAVGTIASIDYDFSLGSLRQVGSCEAIIMSEGDFIGGLYAKTIGSPSLTRGLASAYSRYQAVFWDTSHEGMLLSQLAQTMYVGCWSWNHGGNAIQMESTDGLKFLGCDIGASRNIGVAVNSNNKNFNIEACNISLNGSGGVRVGGSGNTDFHVSRNKFNVDFSQPGAKQGFGVRLDAGCGDYFWVTENSARNLVIGGIIDNSGATNKYVDRNFG